MNKEEMPCPACGGIGLIMGYLCNLAWYRCQNCGMQFNIIADQEEDEEELDDE